MGVGEACYKDADLGDLTQQGPRRRESTAGWVHLENDLPRTAQEPGLLEKPLFPSAALRFHRKHEGLEASLRPRRKALTAPPTGLPLHLCLTKNSNLHKSWLKTYSSQLTSWDKNQAGKKASSTRRHQTRTIKLLCVNTPLRTQILWCF